MIGRRSAAWLIQAAITIACSGKPTQPPPRDVGVDASDDAGPADIGPTRAPVHDVVATPDPSDAASVADSDDAESAVDAALDAASSPDGGPSSEATSTDTGPPAPPIEWTVTFERRVFGGLSVSSAGVLAITCGSLIDTGSVVSAKYPCNVHVIGLDGTVKVTTNNLDDIGSLAPIVGDSGEIVTLSRAWDGYDELGDRYRADLRRFDPTTGDIICKNYEKGNAGLPSAAALTPAGLVVAQVPPYFVAWDLNCKQAWRINRGTSRFVDQDGSPFATGYVLRYKIGGGYAVHEATGGTRILRTIQNLGVSEKTFGAPTVIAGASIVYATHYPGHLLAARANGEFAKVDKIPGMEPRYPAVGLRDGSVLLGYSGNPRLVSDIDKVPAGEPLVEWFVDHGGCFGTPIATASGRIHCMGRGHDDEVGIALHTFDRNGTRLYRKILPSGTDWNLRVLPVVPVKGQFVYATEFAVHSVAAEVEPPDPEAWSTHHGDQRRTRRFRPAATEIFEPPPIWPSDPIAPPSP